VETFLLANNFDGTTRAHPKAARALASNKDILACGETCGLEICVETNTSGRFLCLVHRDTKRF